MADTRNSSDTAMKDQRTEASPITTMAYTATDTVMTENQPQASHSAMDEGSLPVQLQVMHISITLVAKFGKERITLSHLDASTTIAQVKELLQVETRILPKRQKLVGLVASGNTSGAKGVHDELPLSQLKVKGKSDGTNEIVHQFILMGTPEDKIFVDPHERDDLPDVVDDFELDFNAGSPEWLQHKANGENLKKFTAETPVHIMNPPRDGKPLLVLDLDHTLLDFSSKTLQQDNSTRVPGQGLAAVMKRPFMDDFLTKCYPYYDIVVWSQTSWRWLETKLIELGMVTHPGYKFCFVLDKTSMFKVVSTKRDGMAIQHHVKPLQLIWSKFTDRWGSHNTVHIDDLSRNFALNLGNGLKISAFHRKKQSGRRDTELLSLSNYLVLLAQAGVNFDNVDFSQWLDVVSGTKTIVDNNGNSDAGKRRS
jgi:ubiquitin-like domain-containing CTD phosphatase 1